MPLVLVRTPEKSVFACGCCMFTGEQHWEIAITAWRSTEVVCRVFDIQHQVAGHTHKRCSRTVYDCCCVCVLFNRYNSRNIINKMHAHTQTHTRNQARRTRRKRSTPFSTPLTHPQIGTHAGHVTRDVPNGQRPRLTSSAPARHNKTQVVDAHTHTHTDFINNITWTTESHKLFTSTFLPLEFPVHISHARSVCACACVCC